MNRFGKGTASAVPPGANKDSGFSPLRDSAAYFLGSL
jgi:hypothetical protein